MYFCIGKLCSNNHHHHHWHCRHCHGVSPQKVGRIVSNIYLLGLWLYTGHIFPFPSSSPSKNQTIYDTYSYVNNGKTKQQMARKYLSLVFLFFPLFRFGLPRRIHSVFVCLLLCSSFIWNRTIDHPQTSDANILAANTDSTHSHTHNDIGS